MPPFNHLHPAVVHFAIAPLTLAPLIVALGLFWSKQRRGILGAALLLLLAGTVCAVLALLSGEAAERFARATPELRAAVNFHEQIAQRTTVLFGVLTAFMLALWGLPLIRRKEGSASLERNLLILWLVLSLGGVALLLRTGHEGGRMVHDLHTHAYPVPDR